MPLTTVARGRVYEWSHAVGRGAQSGTGFNYPQTMCLAKGGVAYVANRGNENNFGMRVNEVKIGGPGEEELLAEFFQWGEGDGRSTWPSTARTMSTSQMNGTTPSPCSTTEASFSGSGERRAAVMASYCAQRVW